MSEDLTARLLAEIERRKGDAREPMLLGRPWATRELAYLAALRKVVELHRPTDDDRVYRGTVCCIRCCAGGQYPADDEWTDTRNWPCPTIAAIAEAIGVEL